MKFENRNFSLGSMDSDSDPALIKNGSYRYALNVSPINNETGNVGVITNVPGNELIEYDFALEENDFIRVIGSKLDLKRRRVYWMVFASTNEGEKAFVLYYSYETQNISTVFSSDNTLQFSKDGTLQSVNIIYDDILGDTLLWTDGLTEPKKLNVTAGVNRFENYTTNITGFHVGDIVFADSGDIINCKLFFPCICISTTNNFPTYNYDTGELNESGWELLPIASCYPPFLFETMFYQKPITPYFSPNAKYNYDDEETEVEGTATFLRKKSFQTRYKYVYFDGQESEWSPISEAVFSQEPTSAVVNATTGGLVSIAYPTPVSVSVKVPVAVYRKETFELDSMVEYPHAMLAKVKIAIREVPKGEEAGDWYQWKDIFIEEFYKYSLRNSSVSFDFPISGTPGTYYYEWDNISYRWSVLNAEIYTITVEYDGSETLSALDVLDTSQNFYSIPKIANTQDVIDNRMVWGATTAQMNVSKEVVKSISNIKLSMIGSVAEFDIENQVETINTWNPSPSSQNNQNTFQSFTFDLTEALGDYDRPFNANFSIAYNMRVAIFGSEAPPRVTVPINVQIQVSSIGIPAQYDDFETFLETTVINGFQNPIEYSVTVAVNNTTGQMEITFTLNDDGVWPPEAVIVSPAIGLIVGGFYTSKSYLPERTYKNHSTQQFAFVFQDDAGRLSPAIETEDLKADVGHFVEDNLEFDYIKYVARLSHLDELIVPIEAKVMHILRKRSESYADYIQFALSTANCDSGSWNYFRAFKVGFYNLDADAFSSGSANTSTITDRYLYISMNAVNGGSGGAYNSNYNTVLNNFIPQEGDVLRFLYKQVKETGDIEEIYNASFNIELYNERYNTIAISFAELMDKEPVLATTLEDADPFVDVNYEMRIACEIIKKKTTSEQDFYYEIAAQLSCSNGALDIRPSAQIDLFGDAYMKVRAYCINYKILDPLNSVYQNFILQDRNYNDFAASANIGEGRPSANVKGLVRGGNYYNEITSDNLMLYSEKSIQNTDIRKYGTVYDANLQEVDNVFGRIEHIHSEGDTLGIYQEDRLCFVYVGRSVVTELSGDQRVIASQNNVFSDVVYNNGNFGISQDSTSFAVSGYRKYFTDSKRGMVYRQSMDGITPISEFGMSGYFKDVFRKIRNSSMTPIIRGITDDRTDEYILSLSYGQVFEVEILDRIVLNYTFELPSIASFGQIEVGGTLLMDLASGAKYTPVEYTITGWDETTRMVTFYDGLGEAVVGSIVRLSLLITEVIVFSERAKGWTTFLGYDAEWLSGGIQSYHTFVNGQMWLHDIGNTDYNTFHGTQQESVITIPTNQEPDKTKTPLTLGLKTKFPAIEASVTNSEEQESSLTMFENREGTQWSPYLRDSLSLGGLYNGDRLKYRWMLTQLTFPMPTINETQLKLFGTSTTYNESDFTV